MRLATLGFWGAWHARDRQHFVAATAEWKDEFSIANMRNPDVLADGIHFIPFPHSGILVSSAGLRNLQPSHADYKFFLHARMQVVC